MVKKSQIQPFNLCCNYSPGFLKAYSIFQQGIMVSLRIAYGIDHQCKKFKN